MSEYGYFGTPTTYTTPYGSTYNSITGDTTYTAYPTTAAAGLATAAAAATAYPANTGTTYTSYAINTANNTATTQPTYVDWASAATAAAISTAVSANKISAPTTKTQFGRGGKQNWFNRNKNNVNKSPPKTYYCEICKVSCMGALTYKEHCNGQKHKKKESSQQDKDKPAKAFHPFSKLYRCELCDISCTGDQAFAAHMSGMKHNKTMMLFKKLGKTIPEPTMTNNKGEKVEVNLDQIKEEIAKKAERLAKEEAEGIERKNKRQKMAEDRAKKRLDDIEQRRKMMEERRAKWEEERWKREEEWRMMQEQREEEWRQWQETEQVEVAPIRTQKSAGFSVRAGKIQDNKIMMKMHAEIYPTPAELTNIKNLVKVTEDTLKTISQKMKEETETELKEKGLLKEEKVEGEEPMETRVLKGCVRIGDLANGLLLRGDKEIEMLVFCTDKPTLYMLQNVKSKFEEILTEAQKKALTVEVVQNKASFTVTDKKGYKVAVTMSSKAMEEEITAAIITADVAAKVLDRKHCLRVLQEVKHANWFQSNISPAPSAVITLRILQNLIHQGKLPNWKVLSDWLLHVIVGNIIKTSSGRKYTPSDVLRRVLECISSGILYPENGGVYDPCTEPPENLITPLSISDVELVTMEAQNALRALVFNKVHEFLGVEEYKEPEVAPEPAPEQGGTFEGDAFFHGYDSNFEGYDGAPPIRQPRTQLPMSRAPRPPPSRHYGGPPPYGYGPHMGWGPRPRGGMFMRGGPRHMIRRGAPFPGARGRGKRNNNNNRKRKQDAEGNKTDVKKECKEEVGEAAAATEVKMETESATA